MPNIVVLNYLSRVNRLSEPIKDKAVRHIETGYQRELTYRRDDSSFSAFGQSDKAGSTWLTAFVVKSFIQARPWIDVDQQVLNKSIDWLMTRQRKDGSFAEYGEVHNKALQGGSALKFNTTISGASNNDTRPSSTLTSYVLIAILHEPKTSPILAKYRSQLDRALSYVYDQLVASTSPYEMAVGSYALHLANSPHKEYAHRKLMAMVNKQDSGLTFWSALSAPVNKTLSDKIQLVSVSEYLSIPSALDVETTAYALLTLVDRSDVDSAIPTLRWLVSKQNSNGGFASTQDTVIGLQALGAIAQQVSTSTVKMFVGVRSGNSERGEKLDQDRQLAFNFNTENVMVLQQIELEPNTEWVHFESRGFGTAIVQVSYQYNLAVSAERPAFFLNPLKDKTSTENYLQLNVCT